MYLSKHAFAKRQGYLYLYAFGVLTCDTERGITMMQYDNFQNLARIQFANGSVTRYVYSADGAKLRMVHYTAMPNITVATGTIHELTAAETQDVDFVDYLLGGKLLLRNSRMDKYPSEEDNVRQQARGIQRQALQSDIRRLYRAFQGKHGGIGKLLKAWKKQRKPI